MDVSATSLAAPWARRPDESETEYELFLAYLHLAGRRSCLRLALSLSANASPYIASVAAVRKLARRFEWSARTAAWDEAHPRPSLVNPDQFATWDTSATSNPWDQQPGEPDAAYAVFTRYLTAEGRRSCTRALEDERAAQPSLPAASPSPGNICNVAAAWHWHDRAAAWDSAHPAEASRRHALFLQERRTRAAAVRSAQPRPPAADRHPWEQQPRESAPWYARFCRFLSLGPSRTISQAAQLDALADPYSPPVKQYYNSAKHWQWGVRAAAWDVHTPTPGEALPGADRLLPLRSGPDPATVPPAYPPDDSAPAPLVPLDPWERQPGEPPRAFSVFLHFLELGPGRSISRAVLPLPNNRGQRRNHVTSEWYITASRWLWRERAAAWDAHQHSLLAHLTLDTERAAAEHRLAVAEILMDQAMYALEIANLPGLTQEEARRMLGTIWRICKESGAWQRAEFDYLDQLELRDRLYRSG